MRVRTVIRSLDVRRLSYEEEQTSGFCDTAGPDAVRANAHPFVRLAVNNPNPLKIGIPAAFRQIMSVAYPMTVDWTFVAYFAALRHVTYLNN